MRTKKEIVEATIEQEAKISDLFFKKVCNNCYNVSLEDVKAVMPEAVKFTTRTITCQASDGVIAIKNYANSIGFKVK